MAVLAIGASLLTASLLVQIGVWRIALPRSQTLGLLCVFALTPACIGALAVATGHVPSLSSADVVRLILGYTSFALAYAVLYSAIEHQSPTLAIVSHVAAAGADGCTTPELFAAFEREGAMTNRIVAIERGGLVRVDRETIVLTAQGRMYAEFFERAAAVFGLAPGG
jgi:hypothetical protein